MFLKDLDYKLRGFNDEISREKADGIVSKSTKLLVSLIEGNTSTEISHSLSNTLEMSFIRRKLTDIYVKMVEDLGMNPDDDLVRIN